MYEATTKVNNLEFGEPNKKESKWKQKRNIYKRTCSRNPTEIELTLQEAKKNVSLLFSSVSSVTNNYIIALYFLSCGSRQLVYPTIPDHSHLHSERVLCINYRHFKSRRQNSSHSPTNDCLLTCGCLLLQLILFFKGVS